MGNFPRAAFAARFFRAGPALPLVLAAAITLAACGSTADDPGLPKLVIDPDRIAVAGISSGAYMATQVHLAFSDHLTGAGLVAGGPWHCAQGELGKALKACTGGDVAAPDTAALVTTARLRAGKGELAPLSGLRGDRVLVLRGRRDDVVAAPVTRATVSFYEGLAAGVTVTWDGDRDFAHTFPTRDRGGDCGKSQPPYLGHCRFDAAGLLVTTLFGATPPPADSATGALQRFSQDTYRPGGEDAQLAATGYVYVPDACAAGQSCGLLIAFHGCQQNADKVAEAFVRDAGFNRWADAARVVVLYPQTRSSYLPLNPKACWDWWGYTGADYDTRRGRQLQWLANASAALGAPLQ